MASGSSTLSFSSSLMKPSFFKLSQGLEGEAAWQRGGATAIGSTNISDTSNVNDVAGGLDAKEPPDRGRPVAVSPADWSFSSSLLLCSLLSARPMFWSVPVAAVCLSLLH